MKYVFIDSNQYHHLFSRKEGFSENIYKLLISLITGNYIKLLLPEQTRDEVERGRLRKWYEGEIDSIKNQIEGLKRKQEKLEKEFSEFSNVEKLLGEIREKISEKEKEIEDISALYFGEKSKAIERLTNIFSKAIMIQSTDEIINKAKIRKEKGNPPYDSELGDFLIWESLLSYLKKEEKEERVDLIFISSDKKAWGKNCFDRFLENEYKNYIRGDIFYSNKLSDLPSFLKKEAESFTEQLKKVLESMKKEIKEAEINEAKRVAIIDFIASPSFSKAGERAQDLLQYKEKMTFKDYDTIIRGSLENPQIFGSYSTAQPLTEIVKGDNGYVKEEVEKIDKDLWNKFAEHFRVSLKRRSDKSQSSNVNSEEINIKDIPF